MKSVWWRRAVIEILPLEIGILVSDLLTQTPFTFSRWGDGEWNAIFGMQGKNCDGQPYASVADDLKRVLRSKPGYLLGLQPLAARLYPDHITRWLKQNVLLGLHWRNADVLHKASLKGKFDPFLAALRSRQIVLVGPAHLDRLALFPVTRRIVVPDRGHAHGARDKILMHTLSAIRKIKYAVILISAGMTAKGLVHDLHAEAGARSTIIDCGSVWDPYAGVASRKYHKAVLERLATR